MSKQSSSGLLNAQPRALIIAMHLAMASMALQTLLSAGNAYAAEPANVANPINTAAKNQYAIKAGALGDVLAEFAAISGIKLSFDPAMVAGQSSKGLQGAYSINDGFATLLSNSGYELMALGTSAYSLRKAQITEKAEVLPEVKVNDKASTLPEIKVSASGELAGNLPKPYAGGQIARGGQLGFLGNRDFMDTPFSSVSFTEKKIQDQQAQSVTDVIANDPSVKPINSGGGYYDSYLIRGMQAGIRDIAFNGLHGVAPYSFITPQAYERIELVKGPALLLSGYPGALGGIVNLVPKRAKDIPITQITALYSSDSNFGTHIDVGRRFGEQGEWGIRVNGLFRDGDTAIDNNKRQVGLVTVALDYRGERLRFSADLGYQRDYVRGNRFGYRLLPGNAVPSAPSNSSNAFQSFEYGDDKSTYGATRMEFDIKDNLTVFAAVGGNIYKSMLTLSSPTLTADGTTNTSFRRTDFENRTVTREIGMRGNFQLGSVKHTWSIVANDLKYPFLVGQGTAGSLTSNIYSPRYIQEPVGTAIATPTQLAEIKSESVAVADIVSMFKDKVQLVIGGRQQKIYSEFFGVASEGEKFSPSIGLVLKPFDYLSLYGNFMQSLEAGPTAPNTAVNAGQGFAPSVTKSKEFGAKADFGSIAGTLALFELTRPSGGTDPVSNVFGLIGEQRNRGVELIIFGEAAKGVRLFGGATYMQPTITKAVNSLQEGNDAPGVTRGYVSMSGEWDIPAVSGLTAIGRVVRSDSSYLDANNTQKAPGWTRFDLGARYTLDNELRGKPVILRADLLNAFEKDYWQTDTNTLIQGTPRTLLMSATFNL